MDIYELYGNQKPKHTKNTQKKWKERNPIQTLRKPTYQKERDQEKKGTKNNQKTMNKMTINTYLSIITLNANGLNAPLKRQSGRMDFLKWAIYTLITKTSFRSKDIHRQSEGIDIPNKNKARVIILISDKREFKTKNVKRDRTSHHFKGVNSRRGFISCKCLYTQHGSTQVYKANINGHRGRN